MLVYLDCTGSNPFWAIQIYDRGVVYHMPPNPLDASYNSGPSFDGAWDVNPAKAKPGAQLLFFFRMQIFHAVVQAKCRVLLTWLRFMKTKCHKKAHTHALLSAPPFR